MLRPDVQSIAWDQFERADEAIEAGAAITRLALPRIQKYLDQKNFEKMRARSLAEKSETGGLPKPLASLDLAEAIR